MKQNSQGITLIALVITIIVLLILAGISIATLTGENGILTKANTAKEKTEIEEAKEQAKLDIAYWVSERVEKQESTELDDEIVKGILTNKNYVQEAKDTSFITKQGGYEISYSELYKSTVTFTVTAKYSVGPDYRDGLNETFTVEKGTTWGEFASEFNTKYGIYGELVWQKERVNAEKLLGTEENGDPEEEVVVFAFDSGFATPYCHCVTSSDGKVNLGTDEIKKRNI